MTHAKIVARIDQIECEMFRIYRSLMRLRLDLQIDWHVTPEDARRDEPRKAARS